MIHTTFLGGTRERKYQGKEQLWMRNIDFAEKSLDAGDGDVHQIFNVHDGDIVLDFWGKVLTAAPTNSTLDFGYGTVTNYWGNGVPIDATGGAPRIISGTDVWQSQLVADQIEETIEIEVNGASFGDLVSLHSNYNIYDMSLTGHVVSPNFVAVQLVNITGGGIKILDDMTITAVVNKAPLASVPVSFSAADTLDIKATTDTKDVNISSGQMAIYARVIRI